MQEKIWLKNYEDGIPSEINYQAYDSIIDIFEECFKEFQTNDAFYCMGKTYTYDQINILSKKFASFLQNSTSLKKGDRVAIMMPNVLQYPIALFGILRAGMIAVNVNPLYTSRELAHQLKDSNAKMLIILENSCHTLCECLKEVKLEYILTTKVGDLLNFPKSLVVNIVVKHVKKMIPKFDLPQAQSFKDVLFNADVDLFKKTKLCRQDTAFLQYTGGTTGVAKGAELTHGNIIANILQAKAWISSRLKAKQEVIITPLPLYHIFSLTANCFIFSSVGAKNILITNPRDMNGFVKELKKHKFTAFTGVNTLFNGLIANDEFKNIDFSNLSITLGGGMAVQGPVAKKWKEITGCTLIEAYGLTETSPAACINPMNIKCYNGKIGLPLPSTIVKIKDDNEIDMPIGENGEICIKGPQVMKGYWKRPEETKKVMTADGFLKTGDIGYMAQDGFVQIVDRKKDMIVVSGFNVYPNEIEDVVARHPDIFESAVIGIPDTRSGEAVKLFVVLKDNTQISKEEIRDFCKKHLTGYKVPRHIEFRKSLPKSNVGKILRKDLRSSNDQ